MTMPHGKTAPQTKDVYLKASPGTDAQGTLIKVIRVKGKTEIAMCRLEVIEACIAP
ncbi:hypothetical protein [Burkholderia pseudomultivorans]|uniref:hypothetical protein n=1 Tax=Burkholderia pseudomultivorans TaxID=1207504 RepID=UPI000AEA049D|nr:hypothetical protein [Burkholderia pseudomultivorans]